MQPRQHTQSSQARSTPLRPATPVRVDAVTADASDHVEILTPRLRLRSLAATDRAAFRSLYDQSRAHLERFLPLGAEDQTSDSIFDRQLELTIAGDASGKAFRRVAADLTTGELIGAFNLVVVRRGLEWDADTSCWLSSSHTGRGFAAEAFAALLSYGFADLPEGLGLHAVHGFVAPENQASQKLAKSFGFELQDNASTHLTVGDRWQLHEKWSLTIARWQTLAS